MSDKFLKTRVPESLYAALLAEAGASGTECRATDVARQLRIAAFHEAAHAVARLHVGAEPMAVEINEDGSGLSHGSGKCLGQLSGGGQYAAWSSLIIALSGGFAESRVAKQDSSLVFLAGGGVEDYAEAQETFTWLVEHGFTADEHEAWLRAEREMKEFLR